VQVSRVLPILAVSAMSLLFFFGCGKSDSKMKSNWKGGLLTEVGSYQRSSTGVLVNVWIDQEHLVRYSISAPGGRQLIRSSERASAYSKWIIYFDDNGWLWFDSSDIGSSVAKKSPDGTYQEVQISDQPDLIRMMPQEFFDRLPRSIQARWKDYRSRIGK